MLPCHMLTVVSLRNERSLEGFSSFTLIREGQSSQSPSPSPDFSPLWALSVSAFSPLSRFCSGGSSDPCLSPILHRSNATIFLKITSFAALHDLTPIESDLSKNQGRGWGIRAFFLTQSLPLFSTPSKHAARSNGRLPRGGARANSIPFMSLLHTSLDTRGWGARGKGFSLCSSAAGAGALAPRQTLTTLRSPLWYILAAHHVSIFRLWSWGRI
jgi:hypothetical protein